MSHNRTTADYSNEPALTRLWFIAAPLTGAMLSQAIVGIVDTALVGHLGGLALASVSIGSYLVFILLALITGFGTGWHSLVPKHEQGHRGLLGLGLVYGIFIALCLSLVGAYTAADVINLFVLDDRINTLAVYYGEARLWGLPAIVLSIAARIYWSENGSSWQYAKIVLIAHLVNVPISYGLIYGVAGFPAMGAVGAGVGTSIALWLGVLLQFILMPKRHLSTIFFAGQWRFNNLLLLLRFTWPPMVQQLAFALHLAVFLWVLSQLGSSVMAASFAVLNVGLLLILPGVGLGQAALSVIGSSLANSNNQQAIAWSRLILTTGAVTALLVATLVIFISPWLAQLLLINRELQQLMSTALPWYALAMVLETLVIILCRLLLVAGFRKTPLILVSSSQWLLFLPALAWVAPSYGFIAVWWLHLGYRMVVATLLWLAWKRASKGLVTGRKFSLYKV